MIDYGHWNIDMVGEFNPDEYFGFIYLVTNLVTDRKYIGKKQFHQYLTKKVPGKVNRKHYTKDSKWRSYTTSSDTINAELKNGSNFKYEILSLHKKKGSLSYAELEAQVSRNVLRDPLYYNSCVGTFKFLPEE